MCLLSILTTAGSCDIRMLDARGAESILWLRYYRNVAAQGAIWVETLQRAKHMTPSPRFDENCSAALFMVENPEERHIKRHNLKC